MTPFEDDITDAVSHMVWVEVYDCENYELARTLLDILRGDPPRDPPSTYHYSVHVRVRDVLVEELLPEHIASNLNFGITARTILDHALWHGLSLPYLREQLEAWDMVHHFMS